MSRQDVFSMIRRRARKAGIDAALCCYTFRATGITVFLDNGGALNILDTETEVLMYNCTVAQNQGAGDGWGIFVEDASLKIRNTMLAAKDLDE